MEDVCGIPVRELLERMETHCLQASEDGGTNPFDSEQNLSVLR